MRKPRTAQRKIILSSSEDEGDSRPQAESVIKRKAQPRSPNVAKTNQSVITLLSSPTCDSVGQPSFTKREPSELPSLSQSPRKSRSQAQPKSKVQNLPKGKTLHSFFAAAPRSQTSETPVPSKQIVKVEDALDVIQDDALDNASDISTSTRGDREDLRRFKRAHGTTDGFNESLLGGSQKFRKVSAITKVRTGDLAVNQPSDSLPWTEKHAPVNLGELAVHKKKVDEVRQWLDNVRLRRIRKCVLILRGPAGAGKSTTVSLLAREMGIHLQEWKSSGSSNYATEGFVSAAAQFDDFLNRASRYGHLETEDDVKETIARTASPLEKAKGQAIFVEEFPLSSLQGSSSALRTFRNSILKYLAVNTSTTGLTWGNSSSRSLITPVILSVSESLLNCSSISDIFTAHRLFGTELLSHNGVTVIDFNPIAPTLLLKGLELVTRKEAENCKGIGKSSQSLLKKLAESGDMRSAVSSLEFIYLQDSDNVWAVEEIGSRTKRSCKSTALTSMEKDTLELVTQREMSLGLFHAVGKVVYNKREAASDFAEVPLPPTFLPEHARTKVSDVNFNTLIDELGTDVDTFVSALHENYVLSCNAGGIEDTLESIVGCIDGLSDVDLLDGKKDNAARNRSNTGGGESQSWRQGEILFNVAARAIVFALPYPVKRSNGTKPYGKGRAARSDAFKMYYPKSFRLWRQKDELLDLLDLIVERSQRGEIHISSTNAMSGKSKDRTLDISSLPFRPKEGRTSNTEKAVVLTEEERGANGEQNLSSGGTNARYEMLLERIPYIALLGHARRGCSPHAKDIDRLARFTGIDEKGDDMSDSENEVNEGTKASSSLKTRSRKEDKLVATAATLEEQTTDKLVLSEDDIVDD